jgi:beta-barrel assembly-enhancing protease
MRAINIKRKTTSSRCSADRTSLFTKSPVLGTLFFALAFVPVTFAQRTQLKPGMNIFSTQQDVELGQQASQQAEKQLQMLNNARVDSYLNWLGKKLSTKAPGEKYPYQFKGVNDLNINAFALPGGFLYINRGTIEAADNEAQLAGVISHEIAHVALRHGTNQASKAELAQMPVAILGSLTGNSSSVAALITQLGSTFTMESILLKYSRDAERQADIMGTQILFDNAYNPSEMAQFFEKLGTKEGGTDFFSSHPNAEDRIAIINSEIQKLNYQGNYANDSAEFRQIKAYVRSLQQPTNAKAEKAIQRQSGTSTARLPTPSTVLKNYQSAGVNLHHPNNWQSYEQDGSFALAPVGGIVDDNWDYVLACGMMMAVFNPGSANNFQNDLQSATIQFVGLLQQDNPSLRVTSRYVRTRVSGEDALSVKLANNSPLGGNETAWLVTVLRSGRLVYFVFVAPEQEYSNYQTAFENTLSSVRFISR